MHRPRCLLLTVTLSLVVVPPAALLAQADCEEGNGPLDRKQPQSIAPAEIIQKFAAKEAIFKEVRNSYTYTQEVTLQTLNGRAVDGEFKLLTDIAYDSNGKRIEKVVSSPRSTLTRVVLTREDFDDMRNRMPFVMTTTELPQYDVRYQGTQHVDEIDTYVFDIAPRRIEKEQRYFQGRIWVDNHDFQIVKTCGKQIPERHGKNNENLFPRFVTYREQIDGQYWFPSYTRADDFLHFSTGIVHVREIIKYTGYKRVGSPNETPPK